MKSSSTREVFTSGRGGGAKRRGVICLTLELTPGRIMNYSSVMISDKFDKYDPRDIKRFDEDDAYTRLFLRTLHSKGECKVLLLCTSLSPSEKNGESMVFCMLSLRDSTIEKFDHQLRTNANGPKRKALLTLKEHQLVLTIAIYQRFLIPIVNNGVLF